MSTSSRISAIRLVVFLILVAWMSWGPIYRQVLSGENQHLREFRMYGTRARRTCKVLFEQKKAEEWVRVSRWEIEGFSVEKFPSKGQRMLDKRDQATRAGQRLCRKLGEGTELRYRRRCGHVRKGWRDWEVSDDLCGALW